MDVGEAGNATSKARANVLSRVRGVSHRVDRDRILAGDNAGDAAGHAVLQRHTAAVSVFRTVVCALPVGPE